MAGHFEKGRKKKAFDWRQSVKIAAPWDSLVVEACKSAFGKFSFRTMTEVIFKKPVKLTRAVIN